MSHGGFSAEVCITTIQVTGGFHEDGVPYCKAQVVLEGRLIEIDFGKHKGRLAQGQESSVQVEIEFLAHQQKYDRAEEEEKPYAGVIHLWDDEIDSGMSAIVAIVRVTLPMVMLSHVRAMEGKDIIFHTIHDVIKDPTDEQKTDSIIAFVQRVHFHTGRKNETKPVKRLRW